jgi:G3E family GTPase
VRRILEARGGERPMAVIVNEFGDVGVDGDIIAGNSVNLVELTSGCLCCTLRGSLMSAVEELREKAGVEQIVVEATGVASPGDLLEDLLDSRVHAELDVGPLVTVVDAPKFTRLQQMLGEFYEEQVESADVVVLNKVDLAAVAELEAARAEVREINPDAMLLFAEHGDTDLSLVLDGPQSDLLRQMQAGAQDREHDHGHAHAHAPADSFVMDTTGDFSRSGLRAAFARLPEDVWRVKGFLSVDGAPSLLQYTMGQLEIGDADARERGYLVVIGRDLDREAVESVLGDALREAVG